MNSVHLFWTAEQTNHHVDIKLVTPTHIPGQLHLFIMDIIKWILLANIYLLLMSFDTLMYNTNSVIMALFDLRPLVFLLIMNIRFLRSKINFRSIVINVYILYLVLVIYLKNTLYKKRFIICGIVILFIPVTLCIKGYLEAVCDQYTLRESAPKRYFSHDSFKGQDTDIPKIILTYNRYQGEDVEFTCRTPESIPCKWYSNGDPVLQTWRHGVYTKREHKENVVLQVALRIFLIQGEDFGTYSCITSYINKTAHYLRRYNPVNSRNPSDLIITICEGILQEEIQKTIYVRIPPGGIFENYLLFYILLEDENIVINKMINGNPLQSVCDGYENSCSLLLSNFRYFFSTLLESKVTYIVHNVTLAYIVQIYSSICMCPKAFGHHSTSYIRYIYNGSSGNFELIEIVDPLNYIVTPASSPYFNLMVNTTSKRTIDTNVNFVENAINLDVLDENVFYRNLLESSIMIILGILFFLGCISVLFYIAFSVYDIFTVFVFFKMFTCRMRQTQIKRHIVCLACCEEDMRWAVRNIDPIFKEQGHQTFIHHRDSHPGQSDLDGIQTGINACRTFVIVVSDISIQDPMWIHQIDVIMYTLTLREIPKNNFLVVKVNKAVHRPLEEMINLRSLDYLIWNTDQSLEEYRANRIHMIYWLIMSDPHQYLTEK